MDYSENLSSLRAQAWFQALLKDQMLPQSPKVPEYIPREDDPEGRWKYGSGLRVGYLLALKHLGVEID